MARLSAATHLHSALDVLDSARAAERGTAFNDVVASATALSDRAAAGEVSRQSPGRHGIAQLIHDYYEAGYGSHRPVDVRGLSGEPVRTTILAAPAWLGASGDLRAAHHDFAFDGMAPVPELPRSPALYDGAVRRLAECLVNETRFVDSPLYRLTGYDMSGGNARASFGTWPFAEYALTWDLLESELASALAATNRALPLRDLLMPTVESVLAVPRRFCAGGTLALTALARPASYGRPADYVILVQERAAKVLNGAGRLAVIPKCFHQPTNDHEGDVGIGSTLSRELEEELFGRSEVDGTMGHIRVVNPFHESRLTRPMRWLRGSAAWSADLTGFGFNLLNGNYEFMSLIAVDDEAFWTIFSGDVEANWEVEGVRLVSTLNPDALGALALDQSWSDEGLLALLLGLKRLKRHAPDRVHLPDFEIGV